MSTRRSAGLAPDPRFIAGGGQDGHPDDGGNRVSNPPHQRRTPGNPRRRPGDPGPPGRGGRRPCGCSRRRRRRDARRGIRRLGQRQIREHVDVAVRARCVIGDTRLSGPARGVGVGDHVLTHRDAAVRSSVRRAVHAVGARNGFRRTHGRVRPSRQAVLVGLAGGGAVGPTDRHARREPSGFPLAVRRRARAPSLPRAQIGANRRRLRRTAGRRSPCSTLSTMRTSGAGQRDRAAAPERRAPGSGARAGRWCRRGTAGRRSTARRAGRRPPSSPSGRRPPRVEALGREVGRAAEIVARQLARERQALGDAEVEHLDLHRPVPIRTFFGFRSPWMMPRTRRPSTTVSNACARSRKAQTSSAIRTASAGGRGRGASRSVEVLALDVFHVEVEVALQRAVRVHRGHVRVDRAERLLQHGAAPLSVVDLLRVAVGPDLEQLQGHVEVGLGIAREVHVGHAAPAEAPGQTGTFRTRASAWRSGGSAPGSRVPLRGGEARGFAGAAVAGASRMLSRRASLISSTSSPASSPPALRMMMLPKSSGRADGDATTPDPAAGPARADRRGPRRCG